MSRTTDNAFKRLGYKTKLRDGERTIYRKADGPDMIWEIIITTDGCCRKSFRSTMRSAASVPMYPDEVLALAAYIEEADKDGRMEA